MKTEKTEIKNQIVEENNEENNLRLLEWEMEALNLIKKENRKRLEKEEVQILRLFSDYEGFKPYFYKMSVTTFRYFCLSFYSLYYPKDSILYEKDTESTLPDKFFVYKGILKIEIFNPKEGIKTKILEDFNDEVTFENLKRKIGRFYLILKIKFSAKNNYCVQLKQKICKIYFPLNSPNIIEKYNFFKKLDLFSDFADYDIYRLAISVDYIEKPIHSVIYNINDDFDKIYFIYNGSLKITFYENFGQKEEDEEEKKVLKFEKEKKSLSKKSEEEELILSTGNIFGFYELIDNEAIKRRCKSEATSAKLKLFSIDNKKLFARYPYSRFKLKERAQLLFQYLQKNFEENKKKKKLIEKMKNEKNIMIRKLPKINSKSELFQEKSDEENYFEKNEDLLLKIVNKEVKDFFNKKKSKRKISISIKKDSTPIIKNKKHLRKLALVKKVSMTEREYKSYLISSLNIKKKGKNERYDLRKKINVEDFFEFQEELKPGHIKMKQRGRRKKEESSEMRSKKFSDFKERSILNKFPKLSKSLPLVVQKKKKMRNIRQLLNRFSARKLKSVNDFEFIEKEVIELGGREKKDDRGLVVWSERGCITERKRVV